MTVGENLRMQMRCMIAFSKTNLSVTFCPLDPKCWHPRYRSNPGWGTYDRWHRPNGQKELYTSVEQAKASVERYKDEFEVYENSVPAKLNTNNEPVAWRRVKMNKRVQLVEEESGSVTEEVVTEPLITRYRPKTFDEMIGQKDAIDQYHASKKHSRTFVITGETGNGKTTFARCICADMGIRANQIHEINAADYNGVSDMRELADKFKYNQGVSQGMEAIIIDECQMITKNGWSVLYKPLEELPDWVVIIFVTNEFSRLPKQIKDRSTPIYLHLVGPDVLLNWLFKIADKERTFDNTPDVVIELCAREAQGIPRAALSLLGACYHCKTSAQAAKLVRAVLDELSELGVRFARALLNPIVSELQSLLVIAHDTNASYEGIRRTVKSYFSKIFRTSTEKRKQYYALHIMEIFKEPMNDIDDLDFAIGVVTKEEDDRGK